MEAQVLQQCDIAGRKRSHGGLRLLTDAIGDKLHREAAECMRKRFGEGAQRHRRHGLALGPAEVRGDDDPRAALCEFAQGWRHPVDPRGIAHRAFAHRHIQVHPNEDALTGDLDIVERSERRHAAYTTADRLAEARASPSLTDWRQAATAARRSCGALAEAPAAGRLP